MDGVGATHSGKTDIYNVELRMTPICLKQIHDIKNSPEGYDAFKSFFKDSIKKDENNISSPID